jgi:hypothetical protein
VGKGERIMPVPSGEITTTEILIEEEVTEEVLEEEADDSTPEQG